MKTEKMKRLVLPEWIVFCEDGRGHYRAVNTLTKTSSRLKKNEMIFLKRLDGKTDPFKIKAPFSPDEREVLLNAMYRRGVLRDKRFADKSFLTALLTVWKPENSINLRVFSYIINKLLCFLWLPVLIIGCLVGWNSLKTNDIEISMLSWGTITGIIAGMILHEMGHMFACLAYSGKVYEVGVMVSSGLPGAYVIMDIDRIRNKMKRIQITAAGIEMNFLLAGIALLFQGSSNVINGLSLGFALNNIFMGLLNLMFVNGFDGMSIMGELIGIEDMADKSKMLLWRRYRKSFIKRKGLPGKATVATCFIIRLLQLSLPSIIAINIMEMIEWFI